MPVTNSHEVVFGKLKVKYIFPKRSFENIETSVLKSLENVFLINDFTHRGKTKYGTRCAYDVQKEIEKYILFIVNKKIR